MGCDSNQMEILKLIDKMSFSQMTALKYIQCGKKRSIFGTEASLLIALTDGSSAAYNAANIAVNKLCGKLQGSCAQLRLKHCEAMTANVSDAAEIFMSVVPYRIQ